MHFSPNFMSMKYCHTSPSHLAFKTLQMDPMAAMSILIQLDVNGSPKFKILKIYLLLLGRLFCGSFGGTFGPRSSGILIRTRTRIGSLTILALTLPIISGSLATATAAQTTSLRHRFHLRRGRSFGLWLHGLDRPARRQGDPTVEGTKRAEMLHVQ